MPEAKLPTSFKGWLIWLAGGLAGLWAGFVTIAALRKYVK